MSLNFDVTVNTTDFTAKMNAVRQQISNATRTMQNVGKNFDISSASKQVSALKQIISDNNSVINHNMALMKKWKADAQAAFNSGDWGGLDAILKDLQDMTQQTDDLTRETEEYMRALAAAQGSTLSDDIAEANDALEDTDNIASKLKKTIAGLGLAFSAKELINKVISIRGEMQQLEVSFETMLGSAEKATELMSQLTRTAATTPFGLTDVAQGAKQLLAYGLEAEKVNETLIRLGDIAAGLSIPLNDIVYLYGTTMSQGRLYTQDLNQFTGRGIPMIAELAKQFGVAESAVKGLVEEGKVGFPEVQKVIESLTNKGGKFGGLMEAQSKTITGQISNIEDAFDMMFNDIGKKSEGVINTALSGVSYVVENYERFGRILTGLVATYGVYKTAIMTATAAQGFATAADALHYSWLVLTEKAQKMLNTTMLANPYVLIATLIAGVVAAMASMKTETERMREADEAYEAQKQKIIAAEEDHKRKIEELCNVAGNESIATDTRKGALVKLIQQYPDVFKKYKTEADMLSHIRDIKLEIAAIDDKNSISNTANELKKVSDRIKALQSKEDKTGKYFATSSTTGVGVMVGGLSGKEDAELKALQRRQRNLRNKQRKDTANAYFADLTGISNDELESQIKNRENLLAKMAISQKAYGKITGGRTQQHGIFSKDEIQGQLQLLQAEQNKRNGITGESDKSGEQSARNRKAVEERRKAIETEKKAREQAMEKAEKDLQNLQKQNQDAELALMDEGTAKKLAQIAQDYARRKAEIARQEKEWQISNKKAGSQTGTDGLTDDQRNAITEARKNAEDARTKQTEAVNKEILIKEKELHLQLLKEYGDYAQKRRAVEEKLQLDIQEVRDNGGLSEKAKTDSIAILTKKAEEEIQTLEERYKGATKAMADLFEDAAKKSVSEIQSVIDKYETLISYMSGSGNVTENDIINLGFSQKDIEAIKQGKISIKDVTDALEKLKGTLAGKSPFLTFTRDIRDAIKQLKNAKGNVLSVGKAIGNIGSAVSGFIPSIKDFAGDLSDIFGFSDKKIQGCLDGLSGMATAAQGVGQIMSGDIAGGAMAAAKGVSQIVSAFNGLFGADYTQYNRMKERYEDLVKVWDDIISKKEEYISISYGEEAQKAGQEVLDITKKQEEAARELGKAYYDSGASIGSHSKGIRQWKKLGTTAKQELKSALGEGYKDILGGRMKGLFDMSSEQLRQLKEDAPVFWASLYDDVQAYLDKIIECGDKTEELEDKMKEAATGVSFDSFYDTWVSTLSDMDKGTKELTKDFGEYLKKAILQNLIADKYKSKIRALYDSWADAAGKGSGLLDPATADALKKAEEDLAKQIMSERDSLAKVFGWYTSSQQSASSGAFESMSEDTAQELNGRFTALQIAGESVNRQMATAVERITTLSGLSAAANSILSDILTQHAVGNAYLEDMTKCTRRMYNEFATKIEKIVNNTSRL